MWIAFLIATFVCGVAASPKHQVGPRQCAKGAKYWCEDLQNAKSCGAVRFCIDNVWEKMSLPQDDNEICDTCKKMVQEARDQLLSNETQEEIREVFEGTCRIYFPIKVLANACIKFVDEYIPELIEMLASRMDPQTVCATAGLCNAAKLQVKIFMKAINPEASLPQIDCADCKKYVGQVENYLETATKQEVEARILALCKLIPEFADDCADIVTKSFDQIYDFINTNLNPDAVCSLIGLCDETNIHQSKMRSVIDFYIEKNNDVECDFCQQIIQHVKDLITTNTTEEEFKQILLGICHRLGKYEKQCDDFVNNNFEVIYNLIVNELDPKAICTALGLCDKSIFKQQGLPLMNLTPSKKIQFESNDVSAAPKFDEMVNVKIPLSKSTKSPAYHELHDIQVSSISCALCEFALHEIQNMLYGNKSAEMIKHAIETVCDVLPKTIKEECKNFIETYGNAILVLIGQEIDPSIVCVKLGLCKSVEAPINVHTRFPMTKLTPSKKLDPADIQLPAHRLMPNILAAGETNIKTQECDFCQTIIGVIHVLLQDNKTKEAIEHALDSVCNELPQQYQADCKSFIDEYAEQLIDLIANNDPDKICAALDLCPGSKTPVEKPTPSSCAACEVIVGDIDRLLQDETIGKETAKVLEVVCYVVPKIYREQCVTIIDTYGPYILQMLGSIADSKIVCQDIDLCPRPPGYVHLLGGKKCTYGPAYWCANEANAKACKAEEHCKQHVWKK